jgi:hypothetical protein
VILRLVVRADVSNRLDAFFISWKFHEDLALSFQQNTRRFTQQI